METLPECTFPLLGTRMRRESVMEGPMCMNGQLLNELLVDKGRLTLTDASGLGLITQFQYEEIVTNRQEYLLDT